MSATWPIVPLGEVLNEQRQRIENPDANGLPLLGVSNVTGLHRSSKERIVDMSRYFRVERDWFAYNPMRINVGSIGWAETEEQTGVISPDYVVFSCKESVLPRLVYLFLKSQIGLQAIHAETAGSVRERLYFDSLGRILFPLPPLAEQRRIVARIEALVGRISEAKTLRSEAAEVTNAIAKAASRRMIGEHPSDTWVPLHHYVEEIENGWSPACEARPATDEEWGVLKVGAVSFGQFDARENKALPLALKPTPEYEIQPGDFLMSRANTTALAGACAVVKNTRPRLILCDKIFRFRFRKSVPLHRNWLDYVLKSAALRTQIERGATGTSSTMKNISKAKVLELLVPPHSPEEQLEIVRELDALHAKRDSLRVLQTASAAELDALLPAVLSQAFAGNF